MISPHMPMMVALIQPILLSLMSTFPFLFFADLAHFFSARKPPCTYPLTHWRAQIAGLKMSMVLQAQLLIGLVVSTLW